MNNPKILVNNSNNKIKIKSPLHSIVRTIKEIIIIIQINHIYQDRLTKNTNIRITIIIIIIIIIVHNNIKFYKSLLVDNNTTVSIQEK